MKHLLLMFPLLAGCCAQEPKVVVAGKMYPFASFNTLGLDSITYRQQSASTSNTYPKFPLHEYKNSSRGPANITAFACDMFPGYVPAVPSTNFVQSNILAIATLHWMRVTNWSTGSTFTTALGWYGGRDPNKVIHYENGNVRSNLVASIVWDGMTNQMIVNSINIGYLSRNWTERVVKEYSEETPSTGIENLLRTHPK